MKTRISILVETSSMGGLADEMDESAVVVTGHGDLSQYENAIRAILLAEGFPPESYLDLFKDERAKRDRALTPDVPAQCSEPVSHDCLSTRHTDGIHCDKCGKELTMWGSNIGGVSGGPFDYRWPRPDRGPMQESREIWSTKRNPGL